MTEGNGPITKARRRPDWAALAIAAGLIALAIIIATDVSRLANVASYARIGPQTVPFAIAICLGGLGLWTILEAVRGDFPTRERQDGRPVLWIVGGLLAQLVLLRIAGFSIATGVMFGLVAYGLGRRQLWLAIAVGVILSTLVWLIFARGLSLTLPSGPLEAAAAAVLGTIIEVVRIVWGTLAGFVGSFSR